MEYVRSIAVDSVLSRYESCSWDFPDGCKGCLEYVEETGEHNRLYTALIGLFGHYSAPSYVVKRCTRFDWKSYETIPPNDLKPGSEGR
jgi:hypothetical protein